MKEKFKVVVEKLNADEQLSKQLLAEESAEGAQAVLKGAGFEFSITEMMEFLDEITNMELSDEELEGVAGGFFFGGLFGPRIGGPAIGGPIIIGPGPGIGRPGGGIVGPGIVNPGGFRPFRPTW